MGELVYAANIIFILIYLNKCQNRSSSCRFSTDTLRVSLEFLQLEVTDRQVSFMYTRLDYITWRQRLKLRIDRLPGVCLEEPCAMTSFPVNILSCVAGVSLLI